MCRLGTVKKTGTGTPVECSVFTGSTVCTYVHGAHTYKHSQDILDVQMTHIRDSDRLKMNRLNRTTVSVS